MRSRSALIAVASAGLLLSSYAVSLGAQAIPPAVSNAVADMNRPQADKDRDTARHPEAMMAASGIKSGDKVIELVPGGGYVTRLISKIVGQSAKLQRALQNGRARGHRQSLLQQCHCDRDALRAAQGT
jgi:predicted methyltransferase